MSILWYINLILFQNSGIILMLLVTYVVHIDIFSLNKFQVHGYCIGPAPGVLPWPQPLELCQACGCWLCLGPAPSSWGGRGASSMTCGIRTLTGKWRGQSYAPWPAGSCPSFRGWCVWLGCCPCLLVFLCSSTGTGNSSLSDFVLCFLWQY